MNDSGWCCFIWYKAEQFGKNLSIRKFHRIPHYLMTINLANFNFQTALPSNDIWWRHLSFYILAISAWYLYYIHITLYYFPTISTGISRYIVIIPFVISMMTINQPALWICIHISFMVKTHTCIYIYINKYKYIYMYTCMYICNVMYCCVV